MSDFISYAVSLLGMWVKLSYGVYREQGFKAVHKTVHLVKFVSKGCSIFVSAYATLL